MKLRNVLKIASAFRRIHQIRWIRRVHQVRNIRRIYVRIRRIRVLKIADPAPQKSNENILKYCHLRSGILYKSRQLASKTKCWWLLPLLLHNLSFYPSRIISPISSSRSSHRCSVKKGVLRNFSKFTGKHLCHLFFNKVAGLVNFEKSLRTPVLQNIPEHTWYRTFHSNKNKTIHDKTRKKKKWH